MDSKNNIFVTKTKVLGIESFHGPPYNKDQLIGLMVKEDTTMHRGDIIISSPLKPKE